MSSPSAILGYGFAVVVVAEEQAAARERLMATLYGEEPAERLEEPFVAQMDDVGIADLYEREGTSADADGGAIVRQSPL